MMKEKSAMGFDEVNHCGYWALTDQELEKVIMACETLEDEVMIRIGVTLGLRREDMASLKIAGVDLSNGRISWNEQKKRGRPRNEAISPTAIKALKQYLPTIPKNNRGRLFTIKSRQLYNRFNAILTKAGVANRPFHSLRATCVKRAIRAGWTMEMICRLTGDTAETISKYYSVPSLGEMAEVARDRPLI